MAVNISSYDLFFPFGRHIVVPERHENSPVMATPLQIVTTTEPPQGSSCHKTWCIHLTACIYFAGQSNVLARLQALFPASPSTSNSDPAKGLPPRPRTSSRTPKLQRLQKFLKVRIVTYVYFNQSYVHVGEHYPQMEHA